MTSYSFSLIAIFVFAITGVLACAAETRNILSLVVLGTITALGGGTIRDVLLLTPVFWLDDFNYVWLAVAGSLTAFFLLRLFMRSTNLLLYLDAAGVALFAIEAIDKSFTLNAHAGVAVIMGLITGIGGGLLRDTLARRPNLLVSRDLYATPILLGCVVYVLMLAHVPQVLWSAWVATLLIFGFRAAAIHWNWASPG